MTDFGVNTAAQFVNAWRGIDDENEARRRAKKNEALSDAERAKAAGEEEAYDYAANAFYNAQPDAEGNIDFSGAIDQNDPRFQAAQANKALTDQLTVLLKSEDWQKASADNRQKRLDAQRISISNQYTKAYENFRANANQGGVGNFLNNPGYYDMLKVYDVYNDGLQLVKDENGNPVVSKDGKIKIKSFTGTETEIPAPDPNTIHQMVTNILAPGSLEQASTLNNNGIKAWNFKQIQKGQWFKNETGEKAFLVENLLDPNNPTGYHTEVTKAPSGEKMSYQELIKGGYTPVSGESAISANGKTSDAVNTLSKQFKDALNAFSDVEEVFDISGNLTQPGKSAFQAATDKYIELQQKVDSGKSLTISEKKDYNYAKTAMDLYEQITGSNAFAEPERQAANSMGKAERSAWIDKMESNTLPQSQVSPSQQTTMGDLPAGVTEEDVQFTMQKYNMTREQVLSRLKGQ